MKSRIIIEKLNDGHIVVDKQQLSHKKISGNAHQRKLTRMALRRGEMQLEWHRTDRKIFRSGTVEILNDVGQLDFASGVKILPMGSPEIAREAAENQGVADEGRDFAQQMTWAIRKQNDAFVVSKPKRVRVIIEEVE